MRIKNVIFAATLLCGTLVDSDWTSANLRQDLERFIKASGRNRTAASEGAARARNWLKAQTASLDGWTIAEHVFTPDIEFSVKQYQADFKKFLASGLSKDDPSVLKWKNFTDSAIKYQDSFRGKKGVNLVLRKKGTDPTRAKRVLVVGAHYDTITHDHDKLVPRPDAPAPGADDNGAAVVVLLELARKLNTFKPKEALELVFFDFEEAFYLGSRAYAQKLRKDGAKVRLINLEMIGTERPHKGRVKLYARSSGRPGGEQDLKLAHAIGPKLIAAGLKPEILRNNFDRSDNWSFWNETHTAVTISHDWERNFNGAHYHTVGDTPDTLSWDFVGKISRAVENTVRSLL